MANYPGLGQKPYYTELKAYIEASVGKSAQAGETTGQAVAGVTLQHPTDPSKQVETWLGTTADGGPSDYAIDKLNEAGVGSGGGAVASVNGQTGAVVLDAADVGALPNTTTAADIGASGIGHSHPATQRDEPVVAVMATAENWVINPLHGHAEDTSDRFLGTQHVRIDLVDTVNRGVDNYSLDLDLDANLLWVWIKTDDPILVSAVTVSLWDAAGVNQAVPVSTFGRSGWYPLCVDPYAENAGPPGVGFDATAITHIRIWGKASGATALRIGGIQTSPRTPDAFPNGVASFTFDDNWLTQYTYGYPLLAKYGARGTLYTIVDSLGLANHMTLDQLRQMHGDGWEVASHALTYANHDAGFDTLSSATVDAEFAGMADWMVDQGFGRPISLAWPQGKFAGHTALAARYFQLSRIATHTPEGAALIQRNPVYAQRVHSVSAVGADMATTVANAAARGRWLIYMLHGIETGPTAQPLATIEATVATLIDHGVPILPVGEVLGHITRPGTGGW